MPRGIYDHKPGQGFLNVRRTYAVFIGTMLYHTGYARRAAVHAFKRAQKGSKGYPAPAAGMRLMMLQDGVLIREMHCDK